VTPARLVVWSDYLCPWCRLGAARVARLEAEFGERLVVEWKSFLLRPVPDRTVTLDRFRAYTRSWEKPAAEPDAPTFRAWASDAGPPSHSVPPHVLARTAATLGDEAFRVVHQRLLDAYFADSRDITDPEVLAAVWVEAGLPRAALALAADPDVVRAVDADHAEALARGITGVPTAMLASVNEVPVPGALPYESYRRWIARALA
jgi:predicted DsbA family dithiol-disulfide isomerase